MPRFHRAKNLPHRTLDHAERIAAQSHAVASTKFAPRAAAVERFGAPDVLVILESGRHRCALAEILAEAQCRRLDFDLFDAWYGINAQRQITGVLGKADLARDLRGGKRTGAVNGIAAAGAFVGCPAACVIAGHEYRGRGAARILPIAAEIDRPGAARVVELREIGSDRKIKGLR